MCSSPGILVDLDRQGERIMRKIDGKSVAGGVEGPQTILPPIMTAEITRNRKTNRVDYRRDGAARCAFPLASRLLSLSHTSSFLPSFLAFLACLAHFAGELHAIASNTLLMSNRRQFDLVVRIATPSLGASRDSETLP